MLFKCILLWLWTEMNCSSYRFLILFITYIKYADRPLLPEPSADTKHTGCTLLPHSEHSEMVKSAPAFKLSPCFSIKCLWGLVPDKQQFTDWMAPYLSMRTLRQAFLLWHCETIMKQSTSSCSGYKHGRWIQQSVILILLEYQWRQGRSFWQRLIKVR